MKIHFFSELPKKCYLAFSGGVDSVVLLDTLLRRNYEVTLLFVHHNTDFSDIENKFVIKTSIERNLYIAQASISPHNHKCLSLEAYWSEERNKVFQSMDLPVYTAHHLDDCVESYVMTSMQGCSKLILPRNGNVYRPMILTPKENIIAYASEKNLLYLTDPSNFDTKISLRNKVRHNLIPHIKECFPGINKTVKKLLMKKIKEEFSVPSEL